MGRSLSIDTLGLSFTLPDNLYTDCFTTSIYSVDLFTELLFWIMLILHFKSNFHSYRLLKYISFKNLSSFSLVLHWIFSNAALSNILEVYGKKKDISTFYKITRDMYIYTYVLTTYKYIYIYIHLHISTHMYVICNMVLFHRAKRNMGKENTPT